MECRNKKKLQQRGDGATAFHYTRAWTMAASNIRFRGRLWALASAA
jgi:hypothetical protein